MNERDDSAPTWEKWRWTPALGVLLRLAAVLALGALFAVVAADVWLKQTFAWDAPVVLAIHQLSSPSLDSLMEAVTQAGENIATAVALLAIGWFAWRRRLLDAAACAVSFGGAVVLTIVMKDFFARLRPTFFPPLVVETDYSFPSGHVLASVALYGLLAVLLWQRRRRVWALLCGALIILVSLSRVYLGAHFPSDVLASLSLGALWLFIVLVVRRWATAWMRGRGTIEGS
jgi:undecaprenyl-diphosphatase